MRKTLVIALLAGGILVSGALLATATTPTPAFGTLASPFAGGITVAPSFVGDEMRYERSGSADGIVTAFDVFVTAVGPTSARDRFGVERGAVAFDTSVVLDGVLDHAFTCAVLHGGFEPVRLDVTAGEIFQAASASQLGPLGLATFESASTQFFARTSFTDACVGANPLGGVTLRAGDALDLEVALAMTGITALDVAKRSAPATATTFEERPALAFAFAPLDEDAAGPGLVVTLADGLPGVALARIEGVGWACFEFLCGDSDEAPVLQELVGYAARADGARVAPDSGARLPTAHAAGMKPADPLLLDEAAFGIAYPFPDALDAVRSDPGVCVGAFLAANPDAFLANARYDATKRGPATAHVRTDGGWELLFVAPAGHCDVTTTRYAPLAGVLPLAKVVHNMPSEAPLDSASFPYELPAAPPATIASSARVAGLLAAEGHDVATTQHLQYAVRNGVEGPQASLTLSSIPLFRAQDAGEYEGTYAGVDLDAGTVWYVLSGTGATTHGVAVGEDDWYELPPRASGLAAFLGGPARGEGIAASVLVGVGLAALIKFVLLPLYTRLVRSALLDNPVRARLYDVVRSDPGIHRAQLIDFAGVGVGATTRHLAQLVKHRYLVELHEGGFVRYFAAGEVPPALARKEALLRSGSLREVYEHYAAHPDATLREAAAALGLSAPSVHRAKKRLEQAGLLPAAPGVVEAAA